jgi:hypothetical protein
MAGVSQRHVKADVLCGKLLVLIHHVLAGAFRDEALSQIVLQAAKQQRIDDTVVVPAEPASTNTSPAHANTGMTLLCVIVTAKQPLAGSCSSSNCPY